MLAAAQGTSKATQGAASRGTAAATSQPAGPAGRCSSSQTGLAGLLAGQAGWTGSGAKFLFSFLGPPNNIPNIFLFL